MVPVPTVRPVYVERLGIRARWWVVVLVMAVFASTELFAGFGGRVIAVVLAAVLLPTLALLVSSSRTVLRVDAEGLRAGSLFLPYDAIDSVEALDGRQTRLRLGPEADPSAQLVVRGYIHEAVLVRPADAATVPYWLVSTRHPERVIAAVEQAARVSLGR